MSILAIPFRSTRLCSRASFDPYLLLSVACFIISRIIFFIAGVRFDALPILIFWQFIDPMLLETDLLESLVFLHIQPPLFNLFLSMVLKASPHAFPLVFHAFYLLCGLAITLSLYILIVRTGAPRPLGFALTLAFTVSPSSILYENWLFYTYPLCAMLLLLVLLFLKTLNRPSFVSAFYLFLCAAAVALTWSLFHLGWMVLLLAILILRVRVVTRKRICLLYTSPSPRD